MSTAEYIATFASIVVGLAFADLLMSLHRLVRSRRTVQWDWLPIAAALMVLLTIVQTWWRSYEIWTAQPVFTFGQFLPDLLALIMLFFLSAAALPDEVPESGTDLKKYYMENRAYFWGLFAAYVLVVSVNKVIRGASVDGPLVDFLTWNAFNLTAIALMIVMIFTKRRWVHAIIILLTLAHLIAGWVRLSISG
jgi:hypothetical protein